jgi:hypothetical protein
VQAINTYANNLRQTGRQSRAVYMVAFSNGKTNNRCVLGKGKIFSALLEAPTTLQCFVRLQVLWSHESENLSKLMDTSNKLLECSTANL